MKSKFVDYRNVLIISTMVGLIAAIGGTLQRGEPGDIKGSTTDLSEDLIVSWSNLARIEKGLEPLAINQMLSQAAFNKAVNMVDLGVFAHSYQDGEELITPWEFFDEVGYKYAHAGENLAKNYTSSQDLVVSWLDSPTHRDNILSENYAEIGVAVVEGEFEGRPVSLVVQFLGTPATEISVSKFESSTDVLERSESNLRETLDDYPLVVYFVSSFMLTITTGTVMVHVLTHTNDKKTRRYRHALD